MKFVIVISGPTCVGKTAIAVQLAKCLKTQIISADSRQVYRDMQIGTAQPTPFEMQGIKHYLINFLNVKEIYNAYKFETDSLFIIDEILKCSNYAIVVGGTGLYINTIFNSLSVLEDFSNKTRTFLRKKSECNCKFSLLDDLRYFDYDYYNKVDKNNFRRIVRALEVIYSTGNSYSSFFYSKKIDRNFSIIHIGLRMNKETLYKRINIRVNDMIEKGLIAEVENLYNFRNYNSLQTIGYKEIFEFLDKKINLDMAIDKIKINTKQYAKRQFTWFNKSKNIDWISVDLYEDPLEQIFNKIKKSVHLSSQNK